MRRVAAAGAVAAALVLAVGPAEAAFPAPQGRLVVVAETLFGAAPAFLDPATGEVEVFGPPVGVHGSVAMSASGTAAGTGTPTRATPTGRTREAS